MTLYSREIERWPALRDIPSDEIFTLFDRQGLAWEKEEIDYLRDWYGKEDTLSLAYALGRTPNSISQKFKRLQNRLQNTKVEAKNVEAFTQERR